MEYERCAERIIHISPCLVPGLLQTRSYARSLMLGNRLSPDAAEQFADVRIGRQRVLAGRQAVVLVSVIGEMALRYPPCADVVMIEQLHHLLAMSERPNVQIKVLPLDLGRYSPALDGEFVLLELRRDKPVVQVTSSRSMSMLTNARTVDGYREAAETILADAMDADASAKRIAEMAKDLEARP